MRNNGVRVWFSRLVEAGDAKTRAANTIAMVLAWNTPFYPLYVLVAAGRGGAAWTLLHFAVLPAFAAVPFVARRRPRAARMLLVAAGTLNTMFCIWLYGEPAGAQLFLLPCVTLAILLFYRTERAAMLAMLALPVAGYFMLGHYGTPPFVRTPEQLHRLLGVNIASVGTLTAFLAWMFAD